MKASELADDPADTRMMAIVHSAPGCLTQSEWDAVEQEFFVKNKSMRELAMEGHWFIEEIDAEGYDIVVHTVPPLLRFVLIHGFGPAYRRQAKARWGAAS